MVVISEENLARYLAEHTDLVDSGAPVEIKPLSQQENRYADGYLNYLYSAKQGGRACVVKQSREHISSDLDIGRIDPGRNLIEYQTYQLRGGITPERVPRTFHVDEENHLFIAEDLAPMKILRFELCKGVQFPLLGRQIGEFLATSHFTTSAFCLSPADLRALDQHFGNPDMRHIITDFILTPIADIPCRDASEQAIRQVVQDVVSRRAVARDWRKLVDDVNTKKQCLIHGDFHTSNVFVSATDLKVIDMEYTMLGPFSYDIGYFLANIMSQYVAHHFRGDAQMGEYLLDVLGQVYDTYFARFAELDRSGTAKQLFGEILRDSLGYLAMANIGRISSLGRFADYDYIDDEDDRFAAKMVSLTISTAFFQQRQQISTVGQVLDLIRRTTADFQSAA